jgi:hypothetical protein
MLGVWRFNCKSCRRDRVTCRIGDAMALGTIASGCWRIGVNRGYCGHYRKIRIRMAGGTRCIRGSRNVVRGLGCNREVHSTAVTL